MSEKKRKEKKKGNPRRRRMKALGSICIVLLSFTLLFMLYWQPNVGVWGEHYTVGEVSGEGYIKTYNGWDLEVESLMNYSVSGVVLGIKKYDYTDGGSNWEDSIDPAMLISPVDLFIGTGDVAHNIDDYDYKIDRWQSKTVWYDFEGSEEDFDYFETHTDNNHLIAKNENVYQAMLRAKKEDNITLNGELVNIRGRNNASTFSWDSDTNWGDNDCQIWLVDSITINGVIYTGSGEYEFIPPFIIGRYWMPIYVAITAIVVISTIIVGTYYWELGREERKNKNKAKTLVTRGFRGRVRATKIGYDDVGSSATVPLMEETAPKFVRCPQCEEEVGAWETNCLLCGAHLKQN